MIFLNAALKEHLFLLRYKYSTKTENSLKDPFENRIW